MNTEYTNIINAINSDCMIIDNHTNTIITDFRDVVLLNNGNVGLLTNTQHQCINSVYIDEDGKCHLSMEIISGNITGVDNDIFEAVSEYNRSYEKVESCQIIAIHLVI